MTETLPVPSPEIHAPAPPTPPRTHGTAVIKNVFDGWDDPLELMSRTVAKQGDIAWLRFGWLDYIVINHPDGVRRVLVENHKNYVKSRNYQGLKFMLGHGLLTSEGEQWRRQRKLAQPSFHQDRLAGFAAEMSGCTNDLLERWAKEIAQAPSAFDLHQEMMRLTLRIVGRTLFSVDLDGEAREIGDALTTALIWANNYVESPVRIPPWIPTRKNRRFRRAKKTIDRIAYRMIGERRERGADGDDLLGMLMSARDETTGERMTDEQLKDELLTLVLAGHETTANALSFLFYLLSLHPDVERELLREIEDVVGEGAIELSHLPRLSYTKAVVEEAMRLFPPAWVIERQALADDVVMGYRVPRGVTIGIFPYLLHRHTSHWSNPEGFDPARFAPELSEARPKHVYLPFGSGPRFCIGNAFAMMEMQIIVAAIVRRFKLELRPGFRLALDPSVTLRPDGGIWMTLVSRRG